MKTKNLMLFREIIAIHIENHIKLKNTLSTRHHCWLLEIARTLCHT
jgi:hypothetical protein